MMVKLDIYRKFTNALAVAVIVSVGWICYEVSIIQFYAITSLSWLVLPPDSSRRLLCILFRFH